MSALVTRFGTDHMLRRSALAVLAACSLLLAVWGSVGPLTPAKAVSGTYEFCSHVWLKPYGQQPGDRCVSPIGGLLFSVTVISYEHSACVSYLNNVGNVASSWLCTPGKEGSATKYYLEEDGTWKRGVVRNNTTGSGAHVVGSQYCFDCS